MMSRLANLVLIACVVSVNTISIEKVSDKINVTKRETDFFPDWVPFRNKHGNELGEFVSVPKAKPKKRLAPPVNFILRAVVDPESDDYFDKGQGGSEEYFDRKDWSDLNRPADAVDAEKPITHTDISDIDGVVNIITNAKPNIVVSTSELLNNNNKNNLKSEESNESLEDVKAQKQVKLTKLNIKDSNKIKPKLNATVEKKYEDDVEYEESTAERRKPEVVDDDQSENDEKKAKILDSVDDLKERHAKEQRAISEKVKEEEMYKEEHERNNLGHNQEVDKYDRHGKVKKETDDYDEYEQREVVVHDKYRLPQKEGSTTTRKPQKTTKRKSKKENHGKLSVFKNPQLFIIYDDDISEEVIATTTKTITAATRTVPTRKFSRYSSRYTTAGTPEAEDSVRISLVPDISGKDGEPALFFPQTRKNKRRRKNKQKTLEFDTSVAETVKKSDSKELTTPDYPTKVTPDYPTNVTPDYPTNVTRDYPTNVTPDYPTNVTPDYPTNMTPNYPTNVTDPATTALDTGLGGDTTASESVTEPDTTILETGPSAGDTLSTNSDTVTDALTASSDHKGKEKKHEDHHHEKGGGREHKSEHSEEQEEHGKKAYEGVHKDSKTAKGHHDKEDHLGKYSDHGGHDKNHHHESGHYGDHHHEEHGKKQAKYEESGKHSKGHSTKGSHDIHKKEEYEKKVEFFEEDGDSAEEEKHGGYHNEKEHKAGGNYKKANLKADHQEKKHGDVGHFHKGGHAQGNKGHRSSGGHDEHGKQRLAKFQKEGKESGKKWIYHHGYPAKTANLVVIDRRADQMYHGPQYYG